MPKPSKFQLRKKRPLNFEVLESRQLLAAATLTPDADTYVGSGVSGVGSASVLDVRDFGNSGNDRIAYIRFDLSGYQIDTLNSATLSLYKQPGSRSDTIVTSRFKNYGLTNAAGNTPQNWSESTLAIGNVGDEYTNVGGNLVDVNQLYDLDGATANVLESVNSTDGAPQTITGPDLVSFIESRINDDGLVTFITLVDSGSSGRGWGYGSRENIPGLQPELTLDFEGQEAPDPYPENPVTFTRQAEDLDRGLVANVGSNGETLISWRLLGTDPSTIGFNLYRRSYDFGGSLVAGPVLLNTSGPITSSTNFSESTPATQSHEYFVLPVIDSVEQGTAPDSADIPDYAKVELFSGTEGFFEVPLQIPNGGTTPDAVNYTYSANDASVGDVDGDGEYELIVKWDPSNAKDNAHSGHTGNVYLDAYKLDGTMLWRIDLGVNIRAGAHYTQFMVYDLDGDGKAEVALKTAEGSKDALGNYIANDPAKFTGTFPTGVNNSADHRNSGGYILTGYEFLTIFSGETGEELMTTYYNPPRNNDINSDNVSAWGDNYGNRVDRFNAGIAYLDGERPSLVMARGIYTRTVLAAYDWRDGQLTERWVFDSDDPGNGAYGGQGNHQLSIADVDGDGYDEIIYGAMTVDDDGTGLYSTGLGHGDALHVSDLDPSNPGLEVFQPHESPSSYLGNGAEYRDAQTGEIELGIPSTNDVGRGAAFDIDPNYDGYEMWATTNVGTRSIYNVDGTALYPTNNISFNFGIWWDEDPLRELLDGTTISEWQYDASTPFAQSIFSPSGVSSNNGTKSTPALSGDILGDWREEVIFRTNNSDALRIYSTTIETSLRFTTLMHDIQYREAIAWQNVAYNQPPHPSFFLGGGVTSLPQPDIYLAGASFDPADLNQDGFVDGLDLGIMLGNWGQSTTPDQGELDGTPPIDGLDLGILLGAWNPPAQVALATSSVSTEDFPEESVTEELPEDAALVSISALYSLRSSFADTDDSLVATYVGATQSDQEPSGYRWQQEQQQQATQNNYADKTSNLAGFRRQQFVQDFAFDDFQAGWNDLL